ncbi:MAG: GlsB/YeaQ/YmgE family stress response membrane protein [Acidobacteria bacterium]|nr:GlsB/YeaQ/YmgE family stress response membrane protein [Acidobacteriota bacterium]
MGLLLVALIGLVIGAIAKLLVPGPDPGGWFVTLLLGIAGSWVGSFIFGALGMTNIGLLGAIVGAVLLLLAYRLLKRA